MDDPLTLWQLTIRLSDEALQIMSKTGVWSVISQFASNEDWWYKRVEHLVGQELTPRIGKWSRVYSSLKWSLTFDEDQDYGSLMVVQVLMEIGADPSEHHSIALEQAVLHENTEAALLLLSDPRVDPSISHNRAIRIAASNGDAELVQALLLDPRVDPSSHDNLAIRKAIHYGYTQTVMLLLAERGSEQLGHERLPRIDTSTLTTDFRIAVENNRTEVVRLLIARVDPTMYQTNETIKVASKLSNYEIVQMLLRDPRVDPTVDDNYPLRMARKFNRLDIEELLLSDDRVRRADQA